MENRMRLIFKLPKAILSVCLLALICKVAVSAEIQSAGIAEGQILMITNLPFLPESSDGYPFVVKNSMINLPVIAPLKAASLTHDQMKAKIIEAYKQTHRAACGVEIQLRNNR